MESEKFENLLNLALNATERERQKSLNLGVGYEPQENRWELIVKYSGDINRLSRENKEIKVEELSNEYAILNVPESAMDQVAKAVEQSPPHGFHVQKCLCLARSENAPAHFPLSAPD